jgi:hypothetical protein
MNATASPPRRIRRAIVLSIVIHACGLWTLAVLHDRRLTTAAHATNSATVVTITRHPRRGPVAKQDVGRPLALRLPHAAHVRAQTPAVPVLATAASVAESRTAFARRSFGVNPDESHDRIVPAAALPERIGPTSRPMPLTVAQRTATPTLTRATPAAPTVRPAASIPARPTPIPATPAPPTSTPSTPAPAIPTPSPIPTRATEAAFGGLFSQNYPPALATRDVLDVIRSRIGRHFHIRIAVDESGHATDVRFLAPIADESLTDGLRAKLLALDYVPADCNGLHCEGILELVY